MDKQELIKLITTYGDAVINYRSENSRKLKYLVATLDFTTPHIKAKKSRSVETSDTILVFCWDSDSFKLLKYANVTSVIPLSSMLRNSVREQ